MGIGSRIGQPVGGSVGAFALKTDNQKENVLCAVMSKHVAEIYTRANIDEILLEQDMRGKILQPHSRSVDIAAVALPKETKINETFRDQNDKHVVRSLYIYPQNTIPSVVENLRLVFLRGAATELGLGEIHLFTLEYAGLQVASLLIKNRRDRPDAPLCTPGDSGAVVCAADRLGKVVAIAIVVGEVQRETTEKLYLAHMLQDGLEELGEVQNATFTFHR